jgi:tetratricopeptide (TPR) repeat protein
MTKLWRLLTVYWIFLIVPIAIADSQAVESSTKDAGVKAYDSAQYEKAQAIFDNLERTGQTDEVVYYFLGLLAHDKQHYDKAEEYYRKSISTNPSYAEPYSDLSLILLNQKKLAEAEEMATKATVLDPKFVLGFMNLAAVQYTENRYKEAYQSFLSAAKISPSAICNRGDLMLLQYKDANAAIYYYSIVLEAYPTYPFALLNIGNAYRILKRPKDAIGFLQTAYETAPQKQEPFDVIYSTYFRLLLDSGEYQAIISRATEKVGPDYASAQFFLALSYFKLSKLNEFKSAAVRYFEISREARPVSLENWANQMLQPK